MPFQEKLPDWHAEGVEPPESKRNTGWEPGERPPAEYWNWQMNRTYKVLQELQQKAAEKVEVQQAQQTANEAKATADAAQSDVSAHISATTGVHGATSAATANRLVIRDSAGRAKFAAPAASDDVARKAEVDTVQTNLNTHKSATTLDHPDGSVTTAKLADGAVTSGKLADTAVSTAKIADSAVTEAKIANSAVTANKIASGAVTSAKLASGAATDTVIGNRTISDSSAPSSNSGTLTNLLSWLAYMIKAITGKSNWRTAPATTLEAVAAHIANTNNPHGVTKSQVGLGNVQNYGIASQAQAQAGTANNVYMTPLRTKQAIDQFVSIETGTWTPNVEIGGVRASYARRSGTYIRIGNLLYWSFYIELSSKNNGLGAVAIGAFPFPLAPENGTIPMGKITVGYFPQGTYWAYLHLPWNGATFFWLQVVSDVLTGDVSLTGYHLTDDSILAASGVCRIAG